MRILFCNIAWMQYYKGSRKGVDEPIGGGSFVDENQDGSELHNFDPFLLIHEDGEVEEVCRGFVVTKKSRSGADQALHIERLEGCEALRTVDSVEDVLVIYCAAHSSHNFTSIVGWYRGATVYRYYQEGVNEDDGNYIRLYNAVAPRENCVLLPVQERRPVMWKVPRRQTGASYGFGQANIWFAEGREENKLLDRFLTRIVNQIENYNGENWVNQSLEDLLRKQGKQ
ncbi:hypothetical protein [Stomatobaculum longum]|jgi:hypothetical protein|uniref:hypothetical protein n=1 Tax=Stomatobaculum longum TaxID=796942 RepID=UPI0028DC516C|nr:hypothetical protein [Stomatobaculum longum]